MGVPAGSSWVVSSGGGDTFTLYVRDALGVSTPTADSIPPLIPRVPRVGSAVPDDFAQQWDRWWLQSAAYGGAEDVPGRWPSGLPELLRDAHAEWSVDWRTPEATQRRDDARAAFSELLHEVIDELTEELGRMPLFELSMIEIPVEGFYWRRLKTDTVLLSEELKSSRNIIAPLESVIRELVGLH